MREAAYGTFTGNTRGHGHGRGVALMYQSPQRQIKASHAVKRLQQLIALHGDLKIDGMPGVEFWPADREGPAYFFVTD